MMRGTEGRTAHHLLRSDKHPGSRTNLWTVGARGTSLRSGDGTTWATVPSNTSVDLHKRACAVGIGILGPLVALMGAFVSVTESGMDDIHDPGHALESGLCWLSLACMSWLLAFLTHATARDSATSPGS